MFAIISETFPPAGTATANTHRNGHVTMLQKLLQQTAQASP
jgi:hypothetical protein